MVNELLKDKTFVPRAITRNASSDAAKDLAARGAEVATADLWDKESIKKALTGCEAVFGVSVDPTIRNRQLTDRYQGYQLLRSDYCGREHSWGACTRQTSGRHS